jgi:hypothetical protein
MTVLLAAFWCFVLVIVTGCASDSTTSPGEDITIVVAGQGMDVPAAITVRPNSDGELWVTNRGSDSITICRIRPTLKTGRSLAWVTIRLTIFLERVMDLDQ